MEPASPIAARILAVDDTVENLRLLANLLEGHGYEVRPVTSGRQALQAVEHDLPDLILLDITMPGMDGIEVCRRLKALEPARDVPVIFLTALTDTADKVRAFDAGAVDFITKPFQVEEVVARVRTHLALRRARVQLTESYERLRNLERLRDQLVNMVVHDMRSPLMALSINLQMVRETVTGVLADEAIEDLDGAIRAAQAVTQLANDLLDVSRLEENRMPVRLARTDVVPLAREAVAQMSGLDRSRVYAFTAETSADAECDGALVRRVIENLVSNAIKHTPQGGRVAVSVSREPRQVRVAVQDSGPGVPVAERPRIFEKFGTVAARSEGGYHSAGLGLAFCKLAVEAQHGALGVESAEPAGSVFWFTLPAA